MQALLLDGLGSGTWGRGLAARPRRLAGTYSHRRHPSTQRMNLSAVILAGGESSRMGQDKARVKFDGQSLIERAVGTVRSSGISEIFVSGRAGTDYSRLHCAVLHDREPGLGPIAGIERALDSTESSLVLV